MKTFSKSLLIPLIIILCACFNLYSQEGSMAHVAIGASFPTGDFAKNDFTNPSSGFAQTGFNLNLQYAYKFNEYLGLGAAGTADVIEESQTYTQDIRVMNLTVGLGYYID